MGMNAVQILRVRVKACRVAMKMRVNHGFSEKFPIRNENLGRRDTNATSRGWKNIALHRHHYCEAMLLCLQKYVHSIHPFLPRASLAAS
jgi:hypothetical protein